MMRLAWREVRHYAKESGTVVAVIAAALTVFICALSFAGSISVNAERLLFGTVGAPWLVDPADKNVELEMSPAQGDELAATVGADSVRLRYTVPASMRVTDDSAASVTLVGVDGAREPDLLANFGVDAATLDGDAVVIHASLAEQLSVGVGDSIDLRVGREEHPFTVAAVAEPEYPNFLLNGWVLADRGGIGSTYEDDAERVNQVLIDAPDRPSSRDAIASALTGLDGAEVSHWRDTPWSSLRLGPTIWTALVIASISTMFLVVCIGLTSLIQSSLLARLRDMAVMRAAGMRAGSARRLQLAQIVIQYGVAFGIAAVLATLIVLVVNAVGISSTSDAFAFAVGSTSLALAPTPLSYLIPFAVGLATTLVALWFPIRAITRQPVLDLLELS